MPFFLAFTNFKLKAEYLTFIHFFNDSLTHIARNTLQTKISINQFWIYIHLKNGIQLAKCMMEAIILSYDLNFSPFTCDMISSLSSSMLKRDFQTFEYIKNYSDLPIVFLPIVKRWDPTISFSTQNCLYRKHWYALLC